MTADCFPREPCEAKEAERNEELCKLLASHCGGHSVEVEGADRLVSSASGRRQQSLTQPCGLPAPGRSERDWEGPV